MAERYVEVEIKAREKDGSGVTVYGEYKTNAETTHDAAREIADHVIKQVGNERMREIEASR